MGSKPERQCSLTRTPHNLFGNFDKFPSLVLRMPMNALTGINFMKVGSDEESSI
jgi:hypothetical protein